MRESRSVIAMQGGIGIYLDSTWEEVRQNNFKQFKRLMRMRLSIELSILERDYKKAQS